MPPTRRRIEDGNRIFFTVHASPVTFAAALLLSVGGFLFAGAMLTKLGGGSAGPPDAGTQEVASIADGEEAKRRPKPPKKPKEPPPAPAEDPPPNPKQPTVTSAAERMAGEPEIETCRPGDTREQGCAP